MAFNKPERVERGPWLEESYSFHRAHPKETVLAHVSANRDQLVADYFDWASAEPFQEPSFTTMLPRFETHRFGKELEPAAHGLLAFAIRWREEKFKVPPDSPYTSDIQREMVETAALEVLAAPVEGEGSEAMVRRIAIASGLIAADAPKKPLVKRMPEVSEAMLPELKEEVYVGHDHDDAARVDDGGSGVVDYPAVPDEPGESDDDFWLEPDV